MKGDREEPFEIEDEEPDGPARRPTARSLARQAVPVIKWVFVGFAALSQLEVWGTLFMAHRLSDRDDGANLIVMTIAYGKCLPGIVFLLAALFLQREQDAHRR